jgi:hypothetical protein
LLHFEIRVNFFDTHIDLFEENKCLTLLCDFLNFLGTKDSFPHRIGRHENKEKQLFYFGLRILLLNSVVRDRKSKKILNSTPPRNVEAMHI